MCHVCVCPACDINREFNMEVESDEQDENSALPGPICDIAHEIEKQELVRIQKVQKDAEKKASEALQKEKKDAAEKQKKKEEEAAVKQRKRQKPVKRKQTQQLGSRTEHATSRIESKD